MAVETATPVPAAAPPAPTSPATTISATRDAASRGDFVKFNEAHQAQQRGAPLAAVSVADPSSGAEPQKTSKERRQLAENDRIRQAVEDGIAQRLKDERTKWEQARSAAPAAVPRVEPERGREPATALPAPTAEDAIRRPDATQPILTAEQFFAQYPTAPYEAYTRYAAAYDRAADGLAATRQAEQMRLAEAHKAQIDSFVQQLRDAAAADPSFTASLSEKVKTQLKPFDALRRDASGRVLEASGPINVIGTQVYASPVAAPMLKFFSTPEGEAALTRLETVPAHLASLPPALKAQRHIAWMLQEYGKLEAQVAHAAPASSVAPVERVAASPITAAPPPPPTISRATSTGDPEAAALKRGDFAAFNQIELQKRARRHGVSA